MSRTLKNFLTFFLVLVLTVVTVTALSLATQAKTETAAAEYTERLETVQKEETAKLTAVVPEKESLNFWACADCFLLLLSIPAGGGILYIRARRKGRSPEKDAARRYSPRCFFRICNLFSGFGRLYVSKENSAFFREVLAAGRTAFRNTRENFGKRLTKYYFFLIFISLRLHLKKKVRSGR